MSPSPEILKTHLETFLCNLLQGTCFSRGVGLDLQRSLPTPTVLFLWYLLWCLPWDKVPVDTVALQERSSSSLVSHTQQQPMPAGISPPLEQSTLHQEDTNVWRASPYGMIHSPSLSALSFLSLIPITQQERYCWPVPYGTAPAWGPAGPGHRYKLSLWMHSLKQGYDTLG